MKASLNNYRQSPRKVRLVTDMIKRKPVPEALAQLNALPKRASAPIKKLVESALANAVTQFNQSQDELYIKEIRVDAGVVLKRHRPVSRGRAHPIKKRTSHVMVELASRAKK